MKLCKDCKHFKADFTFGYNRNLCLHPDNPGALDVVTGHRVGGTAECGSVRADARKCGLTAMWFDPATLDAKLEMLVENTRTIYLVVGLETVKAYAYRSTAEKNLQDGQQISPVEYWDKQ
jgi:hypothetical protein